MGILNEVQGLSNVNTDLELIKAIALYHSKNINEADSILQKISMTGNVLYEYNSKLLSSAILTKGDNQILEKWKDDWVKNRVLISEDTCNGRYKLLGNFIKAVGIFRSQSINESLSIGMASSGSKSTLFIKMKNSQVIADITVNQTATTNQGVLTDFITTNGKCFSMQQSNKLWSVVFKIVQ